MNIDTFWEIIETAKNQGGNADAISDHVLARLKGLAAPEIEAFDKHQADLMRQSYNWKLWGAAYLINGGCSDDGFEYFRGWLFTKGREVFESAVANPDSLASHVDENDEVECEGFMYIAKEAYKSVAGKEMGHTPARYPELGEGWDFDDASEMSARYPKLWKTFGW